MSVHPLSVKMEPCMASSSKSQACIAAKSVASAVLWKTAVKDYSC